MSGRGTIQRLPDGSFRLWVSAGRDEAGKYPRISERYAGSFREAQRRLAALRADVDSGRHIARQGMTLAQFAARWLPLKQTSVAVTTARNYERMLTGTLLPALGSRPLQKLSASEISSMLSAIVARGSVGQAQHVYITLKIVLRAAVAQGELVKSPLVGVPMPKPPRHEPRVLPPADWQRVRAYLMERESHWLVAFTLLITTGLRRSEAAALRWRDLDLSRGTLRVQRSIHKLGPGDVTVAEPKSARSRRTITVDRLTLAMLAEHRARAERTAAMFERPLSPDAYVFAKADGSAMPPDAFSRAWYRVVQACGLAGVRLHDLRHSSASFMLAAGVPLPTVSARLGHSTPEFTARIYSHALPGSEGDAAERLSALLNATPVLPAKLLQPA